MIQTRRLVPEIYYNQSRDFQSLGRTFEVVFNYLKMNIDLLSGSPLSKNVSDDLISLLTKTLGFETKHQYNTQDLKSICEVFSDLLRDKGTKKSIENAIYTLMNTQNVSGYVNVEDVYENNNKLYLLNISVPPELQDIIILEDLFTYILPAGYDYRFVKATKIPSNTSNFGLTQGHKAFAKDNSGTSIIASSNDESIMVTPDNRESDDDKDFAITFTSTINKPIDQE